MAHSQQLMMSRRMLSAILKPQRQRIASYHTHLSSVSRGRPQPSTSTCLHRYASTTADLNKPIVLEQPDKFRPPSHPQRLNKRPPRQYPGPPLSKDELAAQKTKRYPHMFPNEGTTMHWFLTNKMIHMIIALGTLSFLALISLIQNFLQTSPFAHLIPPISTLPFHPYNYITESLAVLGMHIDYNTERTMEMRRDDIRDAQKRRLYRRAHGIEDMNAEEESGVDVRGLVPWDDGLTKKEREAGGRDPNLTTKWIQAVETRDPETGERIEMRELVKREYQIVDGKMVKRARPLNSKGEEYDPAELPVNKRKKWLGIW